MKVCDIDSFSFIQYLDSSEFTNILFIESLKCNFPRYDHKIQKSNLFFTYEIGGPTYLGSIFVLS